MESCEVQCVNNRNINAKLKELVEALDASYCEELCQDIMCRRERDDSKFTEKRKQGTRNPCIGISPQTQQYVKIPPKQKVLPIKVTIDGRKVFEKPRCIKKENFSYRSPPNVHPRSSSVELRGGLHFKECDCVRRNGLQDDCPRWDCAGRPECNDSPWPTCFPQETASAFGERKINMKAVSTLPNSNKDINVIIPENFQGDIYVCCPE